MRPDYLSSRFSITMILNKDGADPSDYSPAATVKIDCSPSDETLIAQLEYRLRVAELLMKAFYHLTKQSRNIEKGDSK